MKNSKVIGIYQYILRKNLNTTI